jgi:hypothetical protein
VFYFSESKDETSQGGGALAVTWAVLRGSAALAAVLPVNLKVEKEKVFGIANFLLRTGLALSPTEAFYQLDSLSVLEDYRPAVPIIVQPSSILSLNSNNNLEVAVTTVLGKPVPQVEVALVSAHHIGADSPPVWSSQNFNYIEDSGKYGFDFLSAISGLGKYKLRLEVCYITNRKWNNFVHFKDDDRGCLCGSLVLFCLSDDFEEGHCSLRRQFSSQQWTKFW